MQKKIAPPSKAHDIESNVDILRVQITAGRIVKAPDFTDRYDFTVRVEVEDGRPVARMERPAAINGGD